MGQPERGLEGEHRRRKGRGPGSALGTKVFCSRVWVGGAGSLPEATDRTHGLALNWPGSKWSHLHAITRLAGRNRRALVPWGGLCHPALAPDWTDVIAFPGEQHLPGQSSYLSLWPHLGNRGQREGSSTIPRQQGGQPTCAQHGSGLQAVICYQLLV